MPIRHYDEFGRFVGESHSPEEVAAAEREKNEAEAAFIELLWIFAPVSPFPFFGFTFGKALHTDGIHPLFSIIAGLGLALIPIVALYRFKYLRLIYAWLLVPISIVISFEIIADRTDVIWGGFGALVVGALASVYAYYWARSFCPAP